MINTYNRQPLSFGSNKDYDKHFMYGSFNGVNDNKNVLSVDQESFADANNIYVSDDNLLVSRPPIKSIGITNVLKVFTFNNKILVLKNDFSLLAYNQLNEEPIATLQYDIPEDEYKINGLQVEDKIYVFTDLTISNNPAFYALFVNENEFRDAIDYIYTPITTLVTNNVDKEYESPNFLTSAEKTRFIYSALSFVDFARLLNQKVEINIDGKNYIINNWQRYNEKILVNSLSKVNDEDYVDVKETPNGVVILKYNQNSQIISVSFDGNIFYSLPYINIVNGTVPYLSEDGFSIFVFTREYLKRCDLVDTTEEFKTSFKWVDINYIERENTVVINNLESNAPNYGYFISKDVYCYVINYSDSIYAGAKFLYAQWGDNKYYYNIIDTSFSNDNPYIKMYINNVQIMSPTNKTSPVLISFILNGNTNWMNIPLPEYGFESIEASVGVLFITDNDNPNYNDNKIYNNDNIYLRDTSHQVIDFIHNGNEILTNNWQGNLYGLKIKNYKLVENNLYIEDNETTEISNTSRIALEPILPNTRTSASEDERLYDTNSISFDSGYVSLQGTKIPGFKLYKNCKFYISLANQAFSRPSTTIPGAYEQAYTNDLYYKTSFVSNSEWDTGVVATINPDNKTITFKLNNLVYNYNDEGDVTKDGIVVGKIKSTDGFGGTSYDIYLIYSYSLIDFTITENNIPYTIMSNTIYFPNSYEIAGIITDNTITLYKDTQSNVHNLTYYISSKDFLNVYNANRSSFAIRRSKYAYIKNKFYSKDNYLLKITGTFDCGNVISIKNYDESNIYVTGTIYKNKSNLKLNFKKCIKVNTLNSSYKYYFNNNNIQDLNIRLIDNEYIDDTNTKLTYNINIIGRVYNKSLPDSSFPVLNTINIDWNSNGIVNINELKVKTFNFDAYNFKIDKNNETILSDINLLLLNQATDLDIPSFELMIYGENTIPLLTLNNIYYLNNNILYSSYIDKSKEITLDIISNGNYTQKVFDKKAILNEYFLSFDNLVEISSTRRNKDNEFLIYLPNTTEQKYVGNVNELHLLSSSEVGVFLDSEIWTLKSLGLNNDKTYELWSNIKTKLNLGIKAGSEVITSIDGSSVIFATPRGIANMHYQENVQSADQILSYLSDAIQYTYDYYVDKAIKFVVYKYLILCYLENDNKILLFDIKRNTWWKWSYKANISRIFAYNDIVYILSNNSLYKFDTQYDDYTDDGDKIDWSLTTQKLHLGTINHTKFIKRLNIMALGDSEQTCNLRTNMYRNVNHTVKEDTLDVEVKDLRTLVKIFSFMMVNQFQFTLSAYLEDTNNYQLKINTIDLTYQLKGGV